MIQGKQIGQLLHVMFAFDECYSRAYAIPIFSALHMLFLYIIQLMKVAIVKDSLKAWQKVAVIFAAFIGCSGLFWWLWPDSVIGRNNYDRCTVSFNKYSLIFLYCSDMLMDIFFSILFIRNMKKMLFVGVSDPSGTAGTSISIAGTQKTQITNSNSTAQSKITQFLKHQDFMLIFINICSAGRLVASQTITDNYVKFLVLNAFETVRALIVSHNVRILLKKGSDEKTVINANQSLHGNSLN